MAHFLVSVYGGFFGAGMGIRMLAELGFVGLTNLHQMNGLKNFGAAFINLSAAVTFIVGGLVFWRLAALMAVGAILGGILGGGKGAAIGAAAGGGVGAGANTVTRGQQVQIESETVVRFKLSDAIIVHVTTGGGSPDASGPALERHDNQ